eukprot:5394620-Alexandrium_andersonii.AAC.1
MKGVGNTARLAVPVEDFILFYNQSAVEKRVVAGTADKKNPNAVDCMGACASTLLVGSVVTCGVFC